MKKLLILLLCFIMVFPVSAFAAENDEISVLVSGSKLEFDVQPQIIDGRTMVPMRKIFEALGANVQWVGEANLIIATKGLNIMAMEIGKNTFSVTNIATQETKNIELDVSPVIIDSRTLVPVRAISEALNMKVDWDNETRTVLIENISE